MPTDAEIYGYGTIANVLCCLCSLGGAFVLPCAKKHRGAYHVVMSVFMGLAIGTLLSDAVLHLIPEALGLHSHGSGGDDHHDEDHNKTHDSHEEEEEDHHHEGIHVEPFVWYGMIILAGRFPLVRCCASDLYWIDLKSNMADRAPSWILAQTSPAHNVIGLVNNGFSAEQKADSFHKMEESTTSQSQVVGTNVTTEKKKARIAPIAVMIIIGDAIHNFADGLAVAASFNRSIVEGVAITIAIICHEIPHELGDFAVLLQNGFGFGKALIANLLSSLTALLGFYVGVSISKGDPANSQWIFAITAGLFFYISLADMVPQIIDVSAGKPKTVLYNNIGILTGALIIILLSVFEEQIEL